MSKIVTGTHVVEWVAQKTNEFGNFGASVGIGLEKNGELIGGVVFNEYNGVNINIHVASDMSRRWLTKEFLWFIFYYAFEQAKVNRITALIGEGNTHALEFNQRVGFTYETRVKGADPTGDMLILGMFKEQCKWLDVKHEKNKTA